MNIAQMHFDFDLKFDKIASSHRPHYSPAHKDWLLNEAQIVFVKQRYNPKNSYGTAFEVTQKRIDDLSTIHIKYPAQSGISLTHHEDANIYELPIILLKYPYWFFTRGEVEIFDSCINDYKKASIKLIQNDDINYILGDPFNKTDDKEVVANFGKASSSSGASIYFYPGDYSLGQAYVEYIKQPQRMSLGNYVYIDGIAYPPTDCELPTQTHSEIVDLAVNIAAGIIENPNYANVTAQKVFTQE